MKGIAEQHGWSAALAIAEQAAESLIQGRLSMPTAAKSCSTLATVLADMHRECKQKGRPFFGQPFALRCRLRDLISRLQLATAAADKPSGAAAQSSQPPALSDPAQMAAAQAAAEATTAVLLAEERQAGAQLAAKAATKAAKRQRQKERRQASEAAAATTDTNAAASSAATAEAEQPTEAA